MPQAFPNRYVDKGDPQYDRAVRHIFVLQPPLQGVAALDFIEYAQDLKFGFEAKILADSDSIPRSSYGSQGLTLEALKNDVADIVTRSPIEWIRGCVSISLLHHPEKRGKLVSVLSWSTTTILAAPVASPEYDAPCRHPASILASLWPWASEPPARARTCAPWPSICRGHWRSRASNVPRPSTRTTLSLSRLLTLGLHLLSDVPTKMHPA